EVFIGRPALWLRALGRTGAIISPAPNFAYALCVDRVTDAEMDGVDLSRWRYALNGAEPVSPATLRRFVDRFGRWGLRREALTPVYGLAEASLAVTFSTLDAPFRTVRFDRDALADGRAVPAPDGVELVSVGTPLPGTAVDAPVDRVGPVRVSGPSLMRGYLHQPERTAAVLRDGWLDTGDLGFLHGGELFLTGRAKDVLILRGRNHAPHEIEQAVDIVEGVRAGCAAAVAWRPEDAEEERLVVFVEVREGPGAGGGGGGGGGRGRGEGEGGGGWGGAAPPQRPPRPWRARRARRTPPRSRTGAPRRSSPPRASTPRWSCSSGPARCRARRRGRSGAPRPYGDGSPGSSCPRTRSRRGASPGRSRRGRSRTGGRGLDADYAIVGGGPAGLAVAIEAALAGKRAVVVERCRGPVDKACGEGLMPPGVARLRAMGVEVPAWGSHPFTGIRYVDGDVVADGLFAEGPGLGVRRLALSEAMRARAVALGTTILEGTEALGWAEDPDGVTLETTRGPVRARWLVAADGLHSRVRKEAGIEATPLATKGRRLGIRRHFTVAPWSDKVEVWWGDGAEAYVTPVGPERVGVAFLWSGGKGDHDSLLARFPALAARLGPPESAVRGA
ncbi:MAG: FAD-dependent monooxygenase, partial [Myxococcota bacterium]